MRESPIIQRFLDESVQETGHKLILELLQARFGAPPGEVDVAVRSLLKEKQILKGNVIAGTCTDYENFLTRLREETAVPPKKEKSSRSRKKP